jgi:aromatic-L-amino-acid decarboxylase
MHGAGAFRSALDEKLDLAREAAREFRQIPGVELVSEPVLSLFTFRVAPPDGLNAAAFNRAVLSRINARARVFLSGVPWGEAFLLRVCVLSFRTHRAQIQAAVEDTRAAIEDARALFEAEPPAPSDRAGGERRSPVE